MVFEAKVVRRQCGTVAAILSGLALGLVAGPPAWAADGHVMLLADEMQWGPGPKSVPVGAQIAVIEGNPAEAGPFTLRFKMPAGYRIPAHSHPAIEHVTVISGTFHLGMGDKLDESAGKAFPAGSFIVMPVGTNHFAWTSQDTVIQLHGIGPWGLTYVNPEDDPRKTN